MRCKYFCLVKSAVALPNKQADQVQRVHFLLRVGTLARGESLTMPIEDLQVYETSYQIKHSSERETEAETVS